MFVLIFAEWTHVPYARVSPSPPKRTRTDTADVPAPDGAPSTHAEPFLFLRRVESLRSLIMILLNY